MDYQIQANSKPKVGGLLKARESEISIDTTIANQSSNPGPAELFLGSIAACLLKNVERYSEILKFSYDAASVIVQAKRNDTPPEFYGIQYKLTIETSEGEERLDLLHKNITKFGTVFNTVSKSSPISGTIVKSSKNS